MSDDVPAWRKQLESSWAELETLGQQVGRKVVDAAKDAGEEAKKASETARQRWQELEPRLGRARAQVESKLREVTDEAVDDLQGMLGDLRKSLESLRAKL